MKTKGKTQAAKSSPLPLPSPAPIPWKRGHDLGHAFQVVKSRHQNEWVIVAEAITAKDADLICLAVNAHAGLVDALRHLIECYDHPASKYSPGPSWDKARAAIAKAEGKS